MFGIDFLLALLILVLLHRFRNSIDTLDANELADACLL